ncbi:HAD family hydrolase [[Eubacterium] cellulosolvens]
MCKITPNNCVIITDLDGTLINSDLENIKLLTRILKNHGYENKIEIIYSGIVHGIQFNDIMKQINMSWTSREILEKEMFEAFKKRKTDLLPGVRKILNNLNRKGFNLSIVTNNYYNFTLNTLKNHGLLRFFHEDLILCYDNFNYLKPSNKIIGEIFRRSKERALKKCIIIGNTLRDIEFAKNSDLPIIYLVFSMPQNINEYVSIFFKKREELNNQVSYDKLFKINQWIDVPKVIDRILNDPKY